MKNNNTFLYLLLAVVGAFILGFIFSNKKKQLEGVALDIATKEGLDYLTTQTNITKNWFNQLGNTWKQIWK